MTVAWASQRLPHGQRQQKPQLQLMSASPAAPGYQDAMVQRQPIFRAPTLLGRMPPAETPHAKSGRSEASTGRPQRVLSPSMRSGSGATLPTNRMVCAARAAEMMRSTAASMVSKSMEESSLNPGSSFETPNHGALATFQSACRSLPKIQGVITVDSKVQAYKDAFAHYMQLAEQNPQPLLGDPQDDPKSQADRSKEDAGGTTENTSCDEALSVPQESNERIASGQEQMNSILAGLEHRLEEHEQQMHAKHTKLSARWEMRFTALEQTLNASLRAAGLATSSMSEHLAKLVGLAEVREDPVQQAVPNDVDLDSLSRRIRQLEESTDCRIKEVQDDVARLVRDLTGNRPEWPSACPTTGDQVNMGEACDSGGRKVTQPADLDRLVRELDQDRTRLQLALQVQSGRCDWELLPPLIDATSGHSSSSLPQEVGPAKEGSSGLQPILEAAEFVEQEEEAEVGSPAMSGSAGSAVPRALTLQQLVLGQRAEVSVGW